MEGDSCGCEISDLHPCGHCENLFKCFPAKKIKKEDNPNCVLTTNPYFNMCVDFECGICYWDKTNYKQFQD